MWQLQFKTRVASSSSLRHFVWQKADLWNKFFRINTLRVGPWWLRSCDMKVVIAFLPQKLFRPKDTVMSWTWAGLTTKCGIGVKYCTRKYTVTLRVVNTKEAAKLATKLSSYAYFSQEIFRCTKFNIHINADCKIHMLLNLPMLVVMFSLA